MSGNGTSLVNDVSPVPTAAPKKAPSRVAQLSAKIKSVAVATGEKSKLNANQKRPAPVLPQEAKRASERTQELNKYAASKARGEVRRSIPTHTTSCRHYSVTIEQPENVHMRHGNGHVYPRSRVAY
jgi:hypothetical protein